MIRKFIPCNYLTISKNYFNESFLGLDNWDVFKTKSDIYFLRELSSSPKWVRLLCLVSYCSQQLIETRVWEKVSAVAFLEVFSVFVREYSNGFRFLEFSFAFRPACFKEWPTINVCVVAGSLFAQRRARNASDTRVTADEVQGTMGRRKIIGEAHLTLPPSCLVCAQIFIEWETSVYEATYEMCY